MTGCYRIVLLLLTCACLCAAGPAAAETLEQVKAELAAQKQINGLLKQRIETLEAELGGRKIPPPAASADAPRFEADDPEQDRALERTLVRRGTAVLPPGIIEVAPSLVWSRAGGGFMAPAQNIYGLGLDARAGLKGGWMVGASVPLLHREAPAGGNNTGLGDVSFTVWKSLLSQTENRPSVVASVRYTAPTGADFGSTPVPLGNGFHVLTGQLSVTRSIAPIAFYGTASYSDFIGETIRGIDLDRSGIFGLNVGVSLAVTPDISLNTGFNFSFEGRAAVGGTKLPGTRETQGAVELGVGVVLSRNVFLTVSGAFGVTPDSPDVTIGMSLPMRF
ncbi:transporter [Emcibacter sp. SYSU 3D8]|uniref:transporter n=1 Tax=Emcibacter sp. SYSU 3D8 TaxID=3133969 RepID=UPI0031FE6738